MTLAPVFRFVGEPFEQRDLFATTNGFASFLPGDTLCTPFRGESDRADMEEGAREGEQVVEADDDEEAAAASLRSLMRRSETARSVHPSPTRSAALARSMRPENCAMMESSKIRSFSAVHWTIANQRVSLVDRLREQKTSVNLPRRWTPIEIVPMS